LAIENEAWQLAVPTDRFLRRDLIALGLMELFFQPLDSFTNRAGERP
jgi:hypothetical protein